MGIYRIIGKLDAYFKGPKRTRIYGRYVEHYPTTSGVALAPGETALLEGTAAQGGS